MGLSLEEGRAAVSLARGAIDRGLGAGEVVQGGEDRGVFSEPRGAFVTLNRWQAGEDRLRGCIGFPYPVKPLGDAIREAALAAATEDPRFPPVTRRELDSIVVEVSVLTPPRALRSETPAGRPAGVRIGEDGLIVSRGSQSGLLLPQVATEFGLGQEEFLAQACLKAGLFPGDWRDPETQVQVFQAEIFAEEEPRGRVVKLETTRPVK